MSTTVKVPPIPYQSPVVDTKGIVQPIWAKWYNQLYLRAGGASAPSNSDLASATTVAALQVNVTSLQSSVTSINTTLATLTDEVNGLLVGRQL